VNTIAANIPATKKLPRLRWPITWTIVVAAVIVWGMHARLERYITPQRGIGYWLGITGGSLMLLLLVYSARKRVSWLRWMGSIPAWFEFHMVLGVVGPLLILFHSNFSLGATNSNVALICMLLVAGSGVVGRYIYTRLHAHMDGNEDTLEQLKAVGNRLRTQTTSIAFLPGLLDAIDEVAGETGKSVSQIALNWLLQRPTVATLIIGARDEAQLRENLGAIGWSLTSDQIARLDAASEVTLPYPYWHQRATFIDRNPPPV